MTRPSTGFVLRGRARELAAVQALLAASAEGRGGALVLVGDVGSGRSTLLAEAAARAGDAVVLTAAGWQSETGLTLAGLHRMLRPAAGGVVSLPAARTRALVRAVEAGRFESTERLVAALVGLLRAGAHEQPLLCCIDDIHWLDEASLTVFGLVASRIAADRITLLFTAGNEAADLLPGVPRLQLAPLDHADSRDLLAEITTGGLAGDVAGVLATVAGGNPLALVELSAGLTPEQRRGDAAPPLTLPPESRLRREYRGRLAALPADTRRLILLLATDPWLDLGDLARAAAAIGLTVEALEPAQHIGLVRVAQASVAFIEPVVRSLVYDDATLAERRSAHRILADTLDPQAHRLRHRLHRAAVTAGQDPELAAELEAAATADGVDRGVASRALERAAELTDTPAQAGAYLLRAARQAWEGGEPHRARTLLRRIRPADVPVQVAAQSDLLLGEIELRAGGTNHARQTLLDAASDLEPDPELAVNAMMRAGEATLQSGGYGDYTDLAEKALALRRDNESVTNQLLLEYFTGSTAVFQGRYEESKAPLRRVLTLAQEIDDAAALTRGCTAAMLLGDEPEAYRLAIRSAAVARAAGDLSAVPQALDLAAAADCALGRIDGANVTLLEALPLARATGQTSLASSLLAMLGYTAAIYGDRATCAARLREARAQAASHGAVRPEAVIEYALGVLDLVTGRPAEALARLQSLRGRAGRGQLAIGVAATPQLVEAAVRSGERALAAESFAGFEPWALSTDQPLWLAKAARCRAMLAEDEAVAEHEFRQALKYLTLAESHFERAQTELLFGQVLRRRRRPTEAREHLRWALHAFQQVESATWIELAAGELRAAGDQDSDVRTVATDVLTPQQLQIARLAAGGATNREVAGRMSLSPRTVDHHMRNIFSRLGIHSRIELARLIEPTG